MDKAIARVAAALDAGEQIAILADYDVDGATSGALLRRIFRGLGAEPLIYVPDREREGYGPNPGAMQSLKDQGASLVITVDCGGYLPGVSFSCAGFFGAAGIWQLRQYGLTTVLICFW